VDDNIPSITKAPSGNSPVSITPAEIEKPQENNTPAKQPNASKPLVLIYHTHTTEGFNPDRLKGSEHNFSNDLNFSVSKVGEELEKELENKYGIAVVHDTTIYDIPNRDHGYSKSRQPVQKLIQKYPSLKLVIDLHRDSATDKNYDRFTAVINNQRYARVMFVIGTHKNNSKNKKTVSELEGIFNKFYPGFLRTTTYSKNQYNQDLSPGSVLMEVGSNYNSLEEAIRTSKLIAKVISEDLK
jgi:stage II sporulation protein P